MTFVSNWVFVFRLSKVFCENIYDVIRSIFTSNSFLFFSQYPFVIIDSHVINSLSFGYVIHDVYYC